MKLRSLAIVAFFAGTIPAFAVDQIFLEPTAPVSPRLKAQGGASTANAVGLDALFVNPASFADKKRSVTLLSLETTAGVSLTGLQKILNDRNSLTQIAGILDTGNPLLPLTNSLVSTGGVGGESSVRLAWVGGNLGIGFMYQSRVGIRGANLIAADTTIEQTYAGVIGMGFPVAVSVGELKLGLDLRPMQKAYSVLGFSDLQSSGFDLSSNNVQSGFGLAWDLGARWDWERFKTALVVRDVASTLFNFRQNTFADWASKGTFPIDGSTASSVYRIPMVIALGGSWNPDVGTFSSLLSASLSMDFQIPIMDSLTQTSFWTWTHFGGEAVFLKLLAVRAGLNQGYPTFGLGIDLPYVQFNFAIYSDELGRVSGSQRRPGISTELTFHL